MDNTKLSLIKMMKRDLWQRYGSIDYPAEWDGINSNGGGKLSHRFWEYFKMIEFLELTKDSIVLDIGGWAKGLGAGFWGRLLAQHVKKVIIIDPVIQLETKVPGNISLVKSYASVDTLKNLFETHPEITHVSCVSVFEHVEPSQRIGIVTAINEYFKGDIFVASYEYHAQRCHFEHQLTMQSASDLFKSLTKFFPIEYVNCPSWAENSYAHVFFPFKDKKFPKVVAKRLAKTIPLWYPVVVKFERE